MKPIKDPGKPTIDLMLATVAIVERDRAMGFVTDDRLLRAKARIVAREMVRAGRTLRAVEEATGVPRSTIHDDVAGNRTPRGRKASKDQSKASETRTTATRELLAQSDQNDWRTPRKFLGAARAVMGAIDLDPASSAAANETVRAERFYTVADNGLVQPWKGRVWLNPPYGGDARLFIERLISEYEVGNVTEACALLNSHPTETKWFQQLFDYTVCFIEGRIDFGGPSRDVSTTSTHGSAICYLGPEIERFVTVFDAFGAVVRKVQSDWRTPRKFLDAAREVLGAIDLDPASSAEAVT
jgi:ParB family chromosome partitioning protein